RTIEDFASTNPKLVPADRREVRHHRILAEALRQRPQDGLDVLFAHEGQYRLATAATAEMTHRSYATGHRHHVGARQFQDTKMLVSAEDHETDRFLRLFVQPFYYRPTHRDRIEPFQPILCELADGEVERESLGRTMRPDKAVRRQRLQQAVDGGAAQVNLLLRFKHAQRRSFG